METNKCPLGICSGGGLIWYEDNSCSECECRRPFHLQNYLKHSLIPKGYLDKTFDDFEVKDSMQSRIIDKLKEYVDAWPSCKEKGWGVSIISDKSRIGKSHLACAVGHAIIEKYQVSIERDVVLFINVTEWIDKWKMFYMKWGTDSEETKNNPLRWQEANVIFNLEGRMKQTELLILDDIGEAPSTDFVSSKLYTLIEHRSSNLKPILITSNNPWEVIERKYNDDGIRIVNRLQETSMIYTFFLDRPMTRKVRKNKEIDSGTVYK